MNGAGTGDAGRGSLAGRARTVLAWTGVAGWGLWALVRWAGGDRLPVIGELAAPLLAVTPFVAVAAPVPVVAALLLRRPAAAVAAALVAVSLGAAVLPRAFGGGQPAPHGPVIRVMSANLYFGETDADQLVDLVRRGNVDVLSLQELPPEAVGRYERAGLARLLPYKVVDARVQAAGSGLYSRYPLRALPALPRTQMAMPSAELAVSGRKIEITAVHPVPPISGESHRDWRRDIGELPAASGADGAPVRILAGDFNATLDHATLRALIGRGYADAADRTGKGLVHTWGTAIPLTLDHVLVDRRARVRSYTVHDLHGSDHRAVVAELGLP
ncbi:endonuclease/exonuclease/phosphatase family protein [Actinomadura hibisca]|uniref:endonuclease/exonuclease/phosphatase family protein n=1 Tax=Actinomadura hibisca TaxID=68565 RepID=UPI0009FD39E1|nr:endonuclease/exonuclease/phosphatase family protein [Actinomadura hibisca]